MIKVFQCEDEGYGRIYVNDVIQRDYPSLDREMDFFHIDANFDSLSALIDEAQSLSFSMSDKVLLLTGTEFLSKQKRKGGPNKEDVEGFMKYLKNPSDTASIYIIVDGKVQRGEALNALKKVASFFDISSPTDAEFIGYANRIAQEQSKKIDRDAILLIRQRVGGIFRTFVNTVRMLLEYSSNVTARDVDELVSEPLQDNSFELVELMLKGRTLDALSLYRDLIKGGMQAMSILPMLVTQIRFLFEVAYLKSKRMDNDAIGSELKCKPGRIYFASDKLNRVNCLSLLRAMADLSLLEKDAKFELDDANDRLELYILGFNKYLVR